jgi:AAA+ superfamily predicted ATPase
MKHGRICSADVFAAAAAAAAAGARFDMSVYFGLPDENCRRLILRQYAKQLGDDEIQRLAAATGGMSGRDLRDLCEQTERRWASKIIRKEADPEGLPAVVEYMESVQERKRGEDKRYTHRHLSAAA